MPRVVDHDERRRELSAAAFALVRDRGLAAVSVRAVARRAGTSPGALRHYFPSQAELLHAVMAHVVERATERVRAVPASGDPVALALARLRELLPLDAQRAAEADVWLAFTAAAAVEPGLGALRAASDAAVEGLCTRSVLALRGEDAVSAASRAAAVHLWALLDGLALHLRTAPPRTSPAEAEDALRRALESLAAGRGPFGGPAAG